MAKKQVESEMDSGQGNECKLLRGEGGRRRAGSVRQEEAKWDKGQDSNMQDPVAFT